MQSQSLSSFSMEHVSATGQEIIRTVDVEMISINELIQKYCDQVPNVISMDVEGMDDEIVRNINFDGFRPEILCVETITYSEKAQYKNYDLISYIIDSGYIVFSDTFINTIFVEIDAWSAVQKSDSTTIYPARNISPV